MVVHVPTGSTCRRAGIVGVQTPGWPPLPRGNDSQAVWTIVLVVGDECVALTVDTLAAPPAPQQAGRRTGRDAACSHHVPSTETAVTDTLSCPIQQSTAWLHAALMIDTAGAPVSSPAHHHRCDEQDSASSSLRPSLCPSSIRRLESAPSCDARPASLLGLVLDRCSAPNRRRARARSSCVCSRKEHLLACTCQRCAALRCLLSSCSRSACRSSEEPSTRIEAASSSANSTG